MDATEKASINAARASWAAIVLSVGGLLIALAGALGTGAGLWPFPIGLLMLMAGFIAGLVGGIVAVIALFLGRRRPKSRGRKAGIAFVVSLFFCGYIGSWVYTGFTVPPIHEISTDPVDPPAFVTLPVRADNLESIPDLGEPALAAMPPEQRRAAVQARAYGDLQTLHLSLDTAAAMARVTRLVQDRGWAIARVDRDAGTIEATDTVSLFRFRDDIAIRVRPDLTSAGGAIVDMRSISRVGQGDLGVNARRVRAFLDDLKQG